MDLAGQRVTVMGLGRFGGGVGVARYLIKQGADVLVTDLLPRVELADSLAQLAGLPIEYRLGEHNVSDFTTAYLVVANPAVKPGNRFLRAAQAAGVPVTSEIRLLVQALPNRLRTIGVTGTAGKSTTTAMIGHILKKLYPKPPALPGDQTTSTSPSVWVGGNLGGSLLDHLGEINKDDWVVLELSSFMLHGLREDKWSPHIAVVTNITPNHLDWHGNYESYISDKYAIIANQKPRDVAIVGEQVPFDKSLAHFSRIGLLGFHAELVLPGRHNQENALFAVGATSYCLRAGWTAKATSSLADFPGLPHRLQFVLERNAVRYFNDSKCTTPQAAKLAIESFDPGTVHLILGGYDKGSDLVPLAGFAAEHCAGVYTIGATGEGIKTAAQAACAGAEGAGRGAVVVGCGELDVAVREAVDRAKPGQVVLLSPACASWDQFDNYEQRGERFIDLVKRPDGRT
jgi:UDP-N-acetylmuramoylalanine--D-glutamate ligase